MGNAKTANTDCRIVNDNRDDDGDDDVGDKVSSQSGTKGAKVYSGVGISLGPDPVGARVGSVDGTAVGGISSLEG